MARQGQRPSGRAATRARQPREVGIVPVLTKAMRDVEMAVQREKVNPAIRVTFQAVAMLVREERARIKGADDLSENKRGEALKRLDGVAQVMARTAPRDATLIALLAEDAEALDGLKTVLRELRVAACLESAAAPVATDFSSPFVRSEPKDDKQVVPKSVIARQLANPFLEPDYDAPPPPKARPRLLSTWELLGPLLKSFETASGGESSCMELPPATTLLAPAGLPLMPHQAQVVAAAADGHRTFLLADEPGLGKTAQALLSAQAANAYPLLCVVPNVVKTNWAREVKLWTPNHKATVVQGDGDTIDGFSDIVIVNYEVLDRHVGWLGTLGFRGMVVDEAHFIKNPKSQRSRHVMEVSERIRARTLRPLLMALTGTPLINDIEDFLAIWQFLGWIGDKEPGAELMNMLEDNGLLPVDPGFGPEARAAVIDLGIVRRRKVDVAADIPARRIADLPVELDGALGRSIREAERVLARRLVKRYESALNARGGNDVEGIDLDLVRKVASWERQDTDEKSTDENVFTMMRRIGQAKAGLAADYAAQLSRNVGKVVFFAKHIDVMDTAEQTFAQRHIRYVSIRGDQTPKVRAAAIEAFTHDPKTAIIVCSLSAAGVGINLQVASNVVL
ncbi:MAG: DEAD/DEAH box helicase, partial [Mycobacteriales bacterium]